VYFLADDNLSTLLDFQEKKHFKAQHGQRGSKQNMTGASGEDLYLKIPVGTQVYEESEEGDLFIADMTEPGQTALVARGGKGGQGNTRFKSSTNQAPRTATPGELGEEKRLRLELKLIADVGLIGFPNAGKSTLLSVVTNARPQIAGYRFTTLFPNLGIMTVGDKEIILADIPGLIEGAAEGKGLGDEFLRHVERTRVLVHLIDPLSAAQELGQDISLETTQKAYAVIRDELVDYSEKLVSKPELVVISKIDIADNEELVEQIKQYFADQDIAVVAISAITKKNLAELKKGIADLLATAPEPEPVAPPVPVFKLEDL
jgi:GTP-binding protein